MKFDKKVCYTSISFFFNIISEMLGLYSVLLLLIDNNGMVPVLSHHYDPPVGSLITSAVLLDILVCVYFYLVMMLLFGDGGSSLDDTADSFQHCIYSGLPYDSRSAITHNLKYGGVHFG